MAARRNSPVARRSACFWKHGPRQSADYGVIEQVVREANQLKIPEIKALGERVECYMSGRTKAQLINRLRTWLDNIKRDLLNKRGLMEQAA